MFDLGLLDIILSGFSEADSGLLGDELGKLGRSSKGGDAIVDRREALVFAACYDTTMLRGQRAAAMEDWRPWCFCVPLGDRALLSQALMAREGRTLIMPPEGRELKRILSVLTDDAKERGYRNGGLESLGRLEAELSWKTSSLDVSRSCRRIARILADSGFYGDLASEDECAIALEEALVNAIEHGNLELDSSLRPEASLEDDLYEAERARRLADPAYGDRLIVIRVTILREEASIEIEDEGQGFDVERITGNPSGFDVSGKGFWLIKKPFDSASYNEKGNMLRLTRRRPALDEDGDRRRDGYRA